MHLLIYCGVLLEVRRAVLQTLFLAIEQNFMIEACHACIEAPVQYEIVNLVRHLLVSYDSQ